MVLRMETVDRSGHPVSTTDYGSLYLGVDCEPASSPCEPSTLSPEGRGQGEGPSHPEGWGWSTEVAIAPTLAHVYTECARIWNPIHTDRAVALGAGLPDIILHGTATLALAISRTLRQDARGPAAPVRSIACRFGGMVRLPSRLTVRGQKPAPGPEGLAVPFEALAEDGRPAVRDGRLILDR